jgi:hypothetical protein
MGQARTSLGFYEDGNEPTGYSKEKGVDFLGQLNDCWLLKNILLF